MMDLKDIVTRWLSNGGVPARLIGLPRESVFEDGEVPTLLAEYRRCFYQDVFVDTGVMASRGLALRGPGADAAMSWLMAYLIAEGFSKKLLPFGTPIRWTRPWEVVDAAFKDRDTWDYLTRVPLLVIEGRPSSDAEDRVMANLLSVRCAKHGNFFVDNGSWEMTHSKPHLAGMFGCVVPTTPLQKRLSSVSSVEGMSKIAQERVEDGQH